MGKLAWPNCIYDDASIDDAKHTFFHCERWALERRNLETKVVAVTFESFCDVILNSEQNWNSMASYADFLLKSKKSILMREVEEAGRGCGYEGATWPNEFHFEVIPY